MEKKVRVSTVILVIIIALLIGAIAYIILVGKPDLQKLIGKGETISSQTETLETSPTPEASPEPTPTTAETKLPYFDPKNVVGVDKNKIEYNVCETSYFNSDGLTLTLRVNDNGEVEAVVGEIAKSGQEDYGLKKGMKRKVDKTEIITGLSGEATDIVYSEFGQDLDPKSAIFFFILKDGTVQYITVEDLLKSETLKPTGTVKGLTNIVKIQQVEAMERIDETGGPGYVTTVAVDSQGNSYDIGQILNVN